MDPKVKTKWLRALRSGKYKQGRSALRTPKDGFCCLGVLCDLHAKATGGKWEKDELGRYRYLGEAELPPQAVAEWAGFPGKDVVPGLDPNPTVDGKQLAERNDDGRQRFTTIARLIEKYL